jgi:hypothetical protein
MEDNLAWFKFKDSGDIDQFIKMIRSHHLEPWDGLQRPDQFLLIRHNPSTPSRF